jgi:4-amino-4-deoxy-L-arabinose transferase-like glycosyltransferase
MMQRLFITAILVVSFGFVITHLFGEYLSVPLISFDEAWYASIAKNMVYSGNWMYSTFNGSLFTDHPPFGYWLMALSMKLFGISELSSRIPSIISGMGCLLLIYYLAKSRVGKIFALLPSLMMGSALWFLLRTFSGNLDVLFLFLYLLSIFIFEKWLERPKSSFFLLLLTSTTLSVLWLTKTMIGFSILPILLTYFFVTPKNNRPAGMQLIKLLLFALVLTLPWYIFNYFLDDNFLIHHFFTIGMRKNEYMISIESLSTTLLYLRSGIGKWYYFVLISPALALIWLIKNFGQNRVLFVDLIWLIMVLLPFFLSNNTQVWHLIPAYAPLFLLVTHAAKQFNVYIPKPFSRLSSLVIVGFFSVLAVNQFIHIMPLLKTNDRTSEKAIGLAARNIDRHIYFKELFLPSFIYYSEQEHVSPLWLKEDAFAFMKKCLIASCKNVFIVNQTDIEELKKENIGFEIMASASNYSIIGAEDLKIKE